MDKKWIISIVALVLSIALLAWGCFIAYHFPGMQEARLLYRQAFASAWMQMVGGYVLLIVGYIVVRK